MKKIALLSFLLLIFSEMILSKNSPQIENSLNALKEQTEFKDKNLEYQISEIRRDQLNYQIEKDLIRETYKANYDRINLLITFVLGLIGILGFLGIRDINSIKKQFTSELDNLSNLRNNFQTKIKELDQTKAKYDSSIAEITQTNIEQNKKLQVIEIKEKINKCLREKEITRAFEHCVVALELSPNDTNLLRTKAIILCRLGRFSEQKTTLQQIREIEPEDNTYKFDLIEALIFNKEIENARKLIKENESEISSKAEGKLLPFFEVLFSYITDDFELTKNLILNEIRKYDLEIKSTKINGWSVNEALYFVAYTKIGNKQDILRNFIWFLDGQITGKEAIDRISAIYAS